MPLNLTHWTFKHSQTSEMALCIAKNWSSPLPVFILFLNFGPIGKQCHALCGISARKQVINIWRVKVFCRRGPDEREVLSADTSVEGKWAGRGVLSKQGSTPYVFDVHKAPGERNISLLSAVYFSTLLHRGHPITDPSAAPAAACVEQTEG